MTTDAPDGETVNLLRIPQGVWHQVSDNSSVEIMIRPSDPLGTIWVRCTFSWIESITIPHSWKELPE